MVAILLGLAAASTPAASEQLRVTAFGGVEELMSFRKAFETQFPGVTVEVDDQSNTPYFLALRPETVKGYLVKSDIVWGVPSSWLQGLQEAADLSSYRGTGGEALDVPWLPVAIDYPAICVNDDVLSDRGLTTPRQWQDLADSVYQDEIVIPNPMEDPAGWVTLIHAFATRGASSVGDADATHSGSGPAAPHGWRYLDALHQNVISYPPSSEVACRRVAIGEGAIGVASASDITALTQRGARLTLVVPEGASYGQVLSAAATKQSSDRQVLAERFLDFVGSNNAEFMMKYRETSEADQWSFAGTQWSVAGTWEKWEVTPEGDVRYVGIWEPFAAEWRHRYDAKAER